MENSKKLALVTCYFQLNYGSQLQAYATQLLFNKMGVENETICIDGIQNEINKRNTGISLVVYGISIR